LKALLENVEPAIDGQLNWSFSEGAGSIWKRAIPGRTSIRYQVLMWRHGPGNSGSWPDFWKTILFKRRKILRSAQRHPKYCGPNWPNLLRMQRRRRQHSRMTLE